MLDEFLDQEFLKEGKIFLFGEIDTSLSKRIIQQLLYLKESEKKEIILYINSVGGSVSDSLAILDIMEICKKELDISTVALGDACSMAAIILALGTKGKRFCSKNSTIMFHQTSFELPYNYTSKQEAYTNYTKTQLTRINKLVAKYLGKRYEEFKKKIDDELWLTAEEALKYKVADEIL